MSLALLWYAIDARKWFKGPRINVEHLIHTEALQGERQESDTDGVEEKMASKH